MQFLKKYAAPVFIGTLFVTNIFLWSVVAHAESRVLKVSFLNVGQGDAIFIESPTGVQMLIDGGVGNAVLRELGRVMPFWDRSIDVVIATHPDADHIGGFPEVFARYEIKKFIESGREGETAIARELERRADEELGLERIMARGGTVVELGDGVVFDILFPDRDVSGVETNLASIIGKLSYGNTSVLLTGDAPDEIERYLVGRYGKKLDSDILKLGHHGSKTSTAPEFLLAATPLWAVISRSIDNTYGHPHKIVTDRLMQFQIPFLDTALDGRIVFESNGIEWTRE